MTDQEIASIVTLMGFDRCEFGPDNDPCETCRRPGLQLYFQGPNDGGRYCCLDCILAEHAANLESLAAHGLLDADNGPAAPADEKPPLYVYEVSYTDDREGDLRRTTVVATDEGDALDQAAREDYYFGRVVEIEQLRVASEEDIAEHA